MSLVRQNKQCILYTKRCGQTNMYFLRQHMRNVANIVYNLAIEIGLPKKTAVKLFKAGLYHDLGKMMWDNGLFSKPHKLLTEEDKIYILKHPENSVNYLKYVTPNWAYKEYSKGDISIIDLIFLHHEKPDGSGYYHIKDVPTEACLVSIADIFSACIESRSYRDTMPVNLAIQLSTSDFKNIFNKQTLNLINTTLRNIYK